MISSLPGATFVGVVTRSAERRQQLANDYPHVQAFDSLEQLVAAGVDAVVVSTPLDGRPEVVMQAIDLGVAVVSDKPLPGMQRKPRQWWSPPNNATCR